MLQIKTATFVLDKDPGYNDEGHIWLFTEKLGIIRATASGVCKRGSRLAGWT